MKSKVIRLKEANIEYLKTFDSDLNKAILMIKDRLNCNTPTDSKDRGHLKSVTPLDDEEEDFLNRYKSAKSSYDQEILKSFALKRFGPGRVEEILSRVA